MMAETAAKDLCLTLMRAESEAEVVEALKGAGYWERSDCWRLYGDDENVYSIVGSQQSRADAALIEKIVNSIDAQLILQCLSRGIDPSSSEAPSTMRAAVARFFDDADPAVNPVAGLVREWTSQKRTDVARGITLAVTGKRPHQGYPNLTIADSGEGQTPNAVPETFVSTRRTNKINIHFVQGKFNMGGTGVLQFCGKQNLQLIVTRRAPPIVTENASADDRKWSFTVVRREPPPRHGRRRSSNYTYLAPLEAETSPGRGRVLRFAASSMPIFPAGRNPYGQEAEWGSLIKLFEYQIVERGHMFLSGGLLERLDLLLPEPALPIRLHECRDYKGHEGSFETTMAGLSARLADDRANNLEPGFPDTASIHAGGMPLDAVIYAFKKNAGKRYRKSEGIIFTINGQTHGHFTYDFFRRKAAGRMDYLARSLLVLVACDKVHGQAREDLFMNSRDRLRHSAERAEIEKSLEELIKNHPGIRALRERRRREEVEAKLQNEKPLKDVLESILKKSPTLAALFNPGRRISTPFRTEEVNEEPEDYEGKRYPTFFKFKGLDYGDILRRDAHLGRRLRILFETDAGNDYFGRSVDPGEAQLLLRDQSESKGLQSHVLNLHNGIATLNLPLPATARPDDELTYELTVADRTQLEPFVNEFVLHVRPRVTSNGGGRRRRKSPGQKKGTKRERPSTLALPEVFGVRREDWASKDPPFDEYTALRIVPSRIENPENGDAQDIYDFFINMDNVYFKHELKHSPTKDEELLTAQWKYGLVLLGLGLLQEDKRNGGSPSAESDESQPSITNLVERVSAAIAPILLPMIDQLGGLEVDPAVVSAAAGESS